MERLLSCYIDKMVESPHWSLPPFREYVHNEGRKQIEKRRLKEKQPEGPAATTRIGRKLQAHETPSMMKKKPTIDSMSKDEIARMFSEVSLGTKAKPSRNVTTNAKHKYLSPTFEEFLEFILGSNLRGNAESVPT